MLIPGLSFGYLLSIHLSQLVPVNDSFLAFLFDYLLFGSLSDVEQPEGVLDETTFDFPVDFCIIVEAWRLIYLEKPWFELLI